MKKSKSLQKKTRTSCRSKNYQSDMAVAFLKALDANGANRIKVVENDGKAVSQVDKKSSQSQIECDAGSMSSSSVVRNKKRVYTPRRKAIKSNEALDRRYNTPKLDETLKPVSSGSNPKNEASILGHKSIVKESSKNKRVAGPRYTFPLNGNIQVNDGNYSDESDVVIGFDFGTSSSKVVIRDSGRQTAYAVDFTELLGSVEHNYLNPTQIFISESGKLDLLDGDKEYSDLKMRLMGGGNDEISASNITSQSIKVSELTVGYIALVIRYSRSWFLAQTESIYRQTNLFWHVNLGVPSKNYDGLEEDLFFKTIAMAAWRLSRFDSDITIKDAKECLSEALDSSINKENSQWLHSDYVNAHPEVIVEVVGYARSSLRTSGLHLLIDVGATTFDLATFIIHSKEGEDIYPLLDTRVERSGTMVLHHRRLKAVMESFEAVLESRRKINPICRLPDLSHYQILADASCITLSDNKFFKECSTCIGEIIRNTKNCRDPYSCVWEKGVPVFVCGGGGRLSSYRDMIIRLGERIGKGVKDFGGFVLKDIPKPQRLEAPLLGSDYGRLAVAYGLSFTAIEIGKVIPKNRMCNIHKKDKMFNCDDQYVSKDMC